MKISSRNILRKRIAQRLYRQDVQELQSMGTMSLYINLIILLSRLKTLETKYELRSALSTLLICNTTTLFWAGHGLIKLILMYGGRIVGGSTVNRIFFSQRKFLQKSFGKGSRKILRYTSFMVILRKYREDYVKRMILLFILLE